jgi:hypothetical protein
MTIAKSRAVRPGTVAIFKGAKLVYAGPIANAPPADGKQVLVNAADYETYKQAFAGEDA